MKRRSFYRVCGTGVLLVGLLVGCHDSGNGLIHSKPYTETFTACGGDSNGTWEIVGVCIEGNIADSKPTQVTAPQVLCCL
jgi:hypothetical protein